MDHYQATCGPVAKIRSMHQGMNNNVLRSSGFGSCVWFAVVALCCCMTTSALNSEGFALLAFRDAAVNDPKNAMGNWNESDDTPCAWTGVSCDADQQVVSLSLSRQKLVAQIPAQLGALSNLRRLDLRSNALFGSLPAKLFNASLLTAIYLFGNNLSGILPPSLGQLVHLEHIAIGNNSFVGGIPVQLLNCKDLLELSLTRNEFSGSIPVGLGSRLQKLQTLDLSGNNLGGEIPGDLGNLSSLRGVLDLSRNRLHGSIPASLANLPLALSLDLRANNLSGLIPQTIAQQHRTISVDQDTGLCGAPLTNSCPPSPATNGTSARTFQRLGLRAIIAIVVGDVAGFFIVIVICECCLRRKFSLLFTKPPKAVGEEGTASNPTEDSSSDGATREGGVGYPCCLTKLAKLGGSEQSKPGGLIPFDKDVKFDLEELLRASAYVLGKSSQGAGVLYKAMLNEGLTVAVRRLGEGGAQEYKEFESKVNLVGKIRHPNVVSLRACYWAVDEKLLVYDFVPNGTLARALHGYTSETLVREPLSWAERLKIARGCARGLACIHASGKSKLAHMDIKPSNILLGENLDAQLSDVGLPLLQRLARGHLSMSQAISQEGLSSVLPQNSESFQYCEKVVKLEGIPGRRPPTKSGAYLTCPSEFYHPPESVTASSKHKPTQTGDMYAFGVVLLELLTGRSPAAFGGKELDLVSWVRRQTVEKRKSITDVLDSQLNAELEGDHDLEREVVETLQIALLCADASPEKRPPSSEVAKKLEQIGSEGPITLEQTSS